MATGAMMSSPASTSSAGHVPGGSSVNLDEAVLTSKVLLQDKECVLVLVPQKLSCREFASNREAFSLALNHIVAARLDMHDPKSMIITGVYRDPNGSPNLIQLDLKLVFNAADEAREWVDMLGSIMIDNNLRTIEGDKQARLATQKKQQEQEAAKVAELKQMFPNVDDDVLLSVLQANGLNTSACIEPLLSISDPDYTAPPSSQPQQQQQQQQQSNQVPYNQIEQDELLAKMLQDELFLEEMQQNEQFQHSIRGQQQQQQQQHQQAQAAAAAPSGPTISDRIQTMSLATKKSMVDLYHRFTSARKTGSGNNSSEQLGQEMVSLQVKPTEDEFSDFVGNDEEEDDDESTSLIRPKKTGVKPSTSTSTATSTPKQAISLIDDDDEHQATPLTASSSSPAKPTPSAVTSDQFVNDLL